MALPEGTRMLLAGAELQDAPLVERTEMDRGPAKTRRTATDPVVTLKATLSWRTAPAYAAWRAWYYAPTGGGAGSRWFDWLDPRTGATRQARFVAASMGPVVPLSGRFYISTQACALEYLDRMTP